MSNVGIPLRVIQEISGHRTLNELYKYLEVKPEQVLGAAASLSMLTPLSKSAPVARSSLIMNKAVTALLVCQLEATANRLALDIT